MTNYRFGEVVLVVFPFSETRQKKKRPALVILDAGDKDVVLAPTPTVERLGPGDYKLKKESANGLLQVSWVRLAKVACLGKDGILRRLGHLADDDKQGIAVLWQKIYALSI
jgi:mRNA interferase MazF